jgi:hypothetical protein
MTVKCRIDSALSKEDYGLSQSVLLFRLTKLLRHADAREWLASGPGLPG